MVDVATAAGVGASTVSRFLRGVTVRPELAERISKAVRALDYEPDETARALRGGRSKTIGVLLPKVSTIYFSQVLQSIEEAARRRGYTVALLTHQDDLTRQQQALVTLRGCRVEGVVIAAAPETRLVDVLTALPKVPAVAIESFFSPEIDSILLQNRQSAREATEHLIWHGYSTIACIAARPNVFSYKERVWGYSDAMRAHGLEEQLVMTADFDNLARTLGEQFRNACPEAVLALSDVAAGHVLTACQKLNIDLENRPKIISYDDFDFAPLLQVPLTVVRQPVADMVAAVLLSLFRQIDGDGTDPKQTISMPGELVIRRSCGCG